MKRARILAAAVTSVALVAALNANAVLGSIKLLRPNW